MGHQVSISYDQRPCTVSSVKLLFLGDTKNLKIFLVLPNFVTVDSGRPSVYSVQGKNSNDRIIVMATLQEPQVWKQNGV